MENYPHGSGHPQLLLNFGVPLFYVMGNEDEHGYIKGQSGRNFVKNLFSESPYSLSMVDFRMLKTILIKRDQEIFNDFRSAVQEVLHNVYFHCTNHYPEYSQYFIKNKNQQLQSIITAALSILPITEPEDHSEIIIPQLIDNKWQKIWFRVERVRLTPMPFSTPYYAYGLIPIQDSHGNLPINAHAQILFMSTNPMPTASGAHHTIMTDTVPGYSAGEHLYLIGIEKIQQFVDKAHALTKLPVISIGQSLGGSIAVIAHVYQPDKVLAVAFNPPAWLWNLRATYRKKLDECKKKLGLDISVSDQELFKAVHQEKQPIIILSNKGDPIFKVGNYIPEHSEIWRVSSEIGETTSYFSIHKDCFGAHSATHALKFEKISTAKEKSLKIRTFTTIGWQIIAIPLMALHILAMIVKAILHLAMLVVRKLFQMLTPGTVETPALHLKSQKRTHLETNPEKINEFTSDQSIENSQKPLR